MIVPIPAPGTVYAGLVRIVRPDTDNPDWPCPASAAIGPPQRSAYVNGVPCWQVGGASIRDYLCACTLDGLGNIILPDDCIGATTYTDVLVPLNQPIQMAIDYAGWIPLVPKPFELLLEDNQTPIMTEIAGTTLKIEGSPI